MLLLSVFLPASLAAQAQADPKGMSQGGLCARTLFMLQAPGRRGLAGGPATRGLGLANLAVVGCHNWSTRRPTGGAAACIY